MSMDLSVWASQPIRLPDYLPKANLWINYGEDWAYEGDGWQVLVTTAEESPPEEVYQEHPNAKYVAYVTLEPIGADPTGYALLEETIRTLTRNTKGI